ncbi:MAG: sialate O-acetylesterase [Armatimonadota bacterium]
MSGKNIWRPAGALSLLLGVGGFAHADVSLPKLISDGVVLQRNQPVRIWGKASPGEQVSVSVQGRRAAAVAGSDGEWVAVLEPLKAGGPYDLTVSGRNTIVVHDVLVGEVWVCSGQSNMEWPISISFQPEATVAASPDPQLRMFTVQKSPEKYERAEVAGGQWEQASTATTARFSAVGYHFARTLRKALGVPVGMIHTSWGGTRIEAWTSREMLERQGMSRQERNSFEGRNPNAASVLYNGMLAPLAKATITGAIWYQGESNAGNPRKYRSQLVDLVADWRRTFDNPGMVFIATQLAPFRADGNDKTSYAEIREAESMAAEGDPRVGVGVITDVGEETDIHPRKKGPVGERMAYEALRITYGRRDVPRSPKFAGATYSAGAATVRFARVGKGLEIRGGVSSEVAVPGDKLLGFQLAGSDGVFHAAEASIVGKDRVVVRSAKVSDPKAVRFGFVNFPVVNLYGIGGLPAEPFRSDRN